MWPNVIDWSIKREVKWNHTCLSDVIQHVHFPTLARSGRAPWLHFECVVELFLSSSTGLLETWPECNMCWLIQALLLTELYWAETRPDFRSIFSANEDAVRRRYNTSLMTTLSSLRFVGKGKWKSLSQRVICKRAPAVRTNLMFNCSVSTAVCKNPIFLSVSISDWRETAVRTHLKPSSDLCTKVELIQPH